MQNSQVTHTLYIEVISQHNLSVKKKKPAHSNDEKEVLLKKWIIVRLGKTGKQTSEVKQAFSNKSFLA